MYSKLNSKIRIADLGGISNRIVDFLQGQDLKPHGEYVHIVSNLQAQTKVLTMAMDRGHIESELADLDDARDEALSNLHNILKGYASLSIAAVSEPARRLLATFDKLWFSNSPLSLRCPKRKNGVATNRPCST